jgi:hypothetical protein
MATHPLPRPINFPQAMMRRAAEALHERQTNDIMIAVRTVLGAALRNDRDLEELMPAVMAELYKAAIAERDRKRQAKNDTPAADAALEA